MGKLSVDALAIGGLVGFGALVLIMVGITTWIVRKAMTPAPPPSRQPPSQPPAEPPQE